MQKLYDYMLIICLLLLFSCKPNHSTTPLDSFEAPFYFGVFEIPVDNPLSQERVQLGRMLFYEPMLSINNQVSCATCHQQEKAFTDGLAFSIGVTGAPLNRSSMSIANLLWGPQSFFWDGRVKTLEEQALKPIENPDEMGLPIPMAIERLSKSSIYPPLFEAAFGSPEITANRIAMAIAAFERTLISDNSKYDKYLRGEVQLSSQELLGKKLFTTHPDPTAGIRGSNCGDCHSQFLTSGFTLSRDGFSNNGIDTNEDLDPGLGKITGNPNDLGKFKVPTLRNIALTAPYMHDGRFKTLEEVIDHYDHGVKKSETLDPLLMQTSNDPIDDFDTVNPLALKPEEKAALIAFLNTLTDEDFITNEKFANPHHP